ncbi:hypothetical protein EKO27_g8157 [Xylaria grammica]|uniref:CP-type G domain-containing protein n=1 Tax=Xylaria grammica TaxID=363999 RepID=A0A439CXT1_9PEZI|nr:hypothetical protein EKO27_g8157 [Xylaria grammica]
MVLAKSKGSVGLGNTLMNDRFGKGKGSDRRKGSGVTRINHATGEEYITNDRKEAAWVKMRSVTEQGALDEFLATAELAGTDFTAEKVNNVKIIHTDQRNPYLLTATEERNVIGKQNEHKGKLTVPRRPKWDATTTPEELDQRERESFLLWRRGLAELQEYNDLLMTPFERNLEVWRQLWRVIERSDLVVQIVDARNPLMFRSEDLENYVKDVDPSKKNLLLVNKADMMSTTQRKAWSKHFKEKRIAYRFFSASLAKELNEARELEPEEPLHGESSNPKTKQKYQSKDDEDSLEEESSEGEADEESGPSEAPLPDITEDDTRILTVEELEDIFIQQAQDPDDPDRRLEIGLVGYPNVGKSSTINALIGAKKVSVSATPGKTKHFQTIHLSDKVILCDCPGLVFPNFATTKADLKEELVSPQLASFLSAYAKARGFKTQGVGQPDESRAARVVLKDYVSGKLLYVEPPPGWGDGGDFNRELYDAAHLPAKRRAQLQAAMEALDVGDDESTMDTDILALPTGAKSQSLDKSFFARGASNGGHLSMPFNHKYTEQGKAQAAAKELSGRKARTMIALETGLDPSEVRLGSSKKHYKGRAKGKGKKFDNKMLDS